MPLLTYNGSIPFDPFKATYDKTQDWKHYPYAKTKDDCGYWIKDSQLVQLSDEELAEMKKSLKPYMAKWLDGDLQQD